MGEFGNHPTERVIDLLLPKRVVEVVVAADHMGYPHIVVVDHDREIVGRSAVCPQDDLIVELGIRNRNLALNMVADCRRALMRGFQPDDRGHSGRGLRRIAVPPSPVIAYRTFFGTRPLAHRVELSRRAIATIGTPRCEELTSNFGVPCGTGGLVDDLAVPGEAEPV